MGAVFEAAGDVVGLLTAPIAVPIIMAKDKIEEVFSGCGGSVGSTDSYNEDNASETTNLSAILNEYKTKIEKECDALEKQAVKTASTQIDEFISQIETINGVKIDGVPIRIDINGVRRRKRDQEKRINGYIKNHVQQRISLVDEECLSILKMPKGSKKSKAMDDFSKKVLKEGIDELNTDLKDTINSMFEDVKYTITERLNTIEETINTRMVNYNRMKSALENNTQEMEICLCYKKSAVYRHILNSLDEKN